MKKKKKQVKVSGRRQACTRRIRHAGKEIRKQSEVWGKDEERIRGRGQRGERLY